MHKFKVETNETIGRHAVLINNASAGDIVVNEIPFVVGPKQNTPVICLECYCPVNIKNPLSRCSICGWPLCNDCQKNIIIKHSIECELFSKENVLFHSEIYSSSLIECPQLDCITPLRIQSNCVLGRYLIANDEVIADEIIIDELPFAYGPKLNSKVVCLECYCPVDCRKNGPRCLRCKWPLCDICTGCEIHKDECKIFQDNKIQFQSLENDQFGCPQLDCITPMRVLLKKEIDPKLWEELVAPMEYHDGPRRAATEIWNADLINVVRYLQGPCKLNRFSEELIMQVIGILEVNAFEARTPMGYPFRGLYPKTGIIAHKCVPNTTRSIYPSEGYRMRLRAMVDLKVDQQLTHSYTYTLNGTATRLEHLKNGKYFTCNCERCMDPTELGTYFSSFQCNECEYGMITTTNPFDCNANWQCSKCNIEINAEDMENSIRIMQSEIDDIQAMEQNVNRLKLTEELYQKYSKILSPLHFMQTALRQNLIELYGRVKGYEMLNLSDKLLEHKEQLCRQVLQVLNVFEPGISRSRAMMLYELHVPMVLLAKSQFVARVISPNVLKKRLQEAINVLYECYNILQNEDPSSHEGNLSFIAQKAMEQLENSIDTIN